MIPLGNPDAWVCGCIALARRVAWLCAYYFLLQSSFASASLVSVRLDGRDS